MLIIIHQFFFLKSLNHDNFLKIALILRRLRLYLTIINSYNKYTTGKLIFFTLENSLKDFLFPIRHKVNTYIYIYI